MSRKNTKCEEFDEATIDHLADKIRAKILKSIREMIREEMPGLVKFAVKEEMTKLIGKVNELNEENNRLKTRIDIVETQLRANNLVICGLPDASLAEVVATSSGDKAGQEQGVTRRDTIQAVVNCCNSKLGANISENDIQASYRIPSKSGPRPIVGSFTSKMVRDRVYALRKSLHKDRSSKIFINEHLTKPNSEIFARARKLVKDKKLSSAWTWNGHVYFKKGENSGLIRVHNLLDLEKY